MALDLKQYAATLRITDGAWGTQLHTRGLAPGSCGELWNVTRAADVEAVAQSYIRAGSEVIMTNTLLANRFMLGQHGLADRAAELAEAGAVISRRAVAGAGRDVKVFASLGPTGKIVMVEEVSPDAIVNAFAELAEALAFGGVDAIVLETFNEMDELKLAIQGVRQATDLPIVACMTFASGADKTATMMGNTPADLVRAAAKLGANAVGANCGVGPDNYVKVAALLRRACDAAKASLPVWIKPNAGMPQVAADGAASFPMGPAEFASFAPKLAQAGANFLGGCCGTTPAHIEALRDAVHSLR